MANVKLQLARQRWKSKGLCQNCGTNPTTKYRCSICSTKHTNSNKAYYEATGKELARERERTIKLEAFKAYGGVVCACCGESGEQFLTIDHINNDGHLHRQAVRKNMYRWLMNANYPEGFQVLCFNCNCGKSINGGICPHKEME